MVGAIRLVAQWWIWVALVFVVLAVLFWRQSILAKRDAKFSIYGLEKEQLQRRKASSRGRALLMLLLVACVYSVNRYAVPLLPEVGGNTEPTSIGSPQPTATATRTPAVVVQFPQGTGEPGQAIPLGSGTPAPTATPTSGTPTVTPTPEATATAAPAPASACATTGVQIFSPGSGATVSGAVAVSGTADIAGFQFYKLEIAVGEQPSGWTVIGEMHYAAVQAGTLATWDTSPLAAGTYWLRLVVVDQTGNYPAPCAVRVSVVK
ncbi:MAG: hypothetical protein ACYC5O_12990 [Anaerolineae bacterium]